MHPLQDLGVSADAERIYLGLVERGEASASEFPQVCLVELERLGLIKLKEDQVIAFPPQLAMERLAQRHTREAALARESATVLAQLRAAGIGQRDDLELPPPEAARAVLDRAQTDAVSHVRAMTVGTWPHPTTRSSRRRTARPNGCSLV